MELIVLAIIAAALLYWRGFKVVPEHQRIEVFRLGRSIGVKGPGVVFLIPIIDQAVPVDPRNR